MLDLNNDWDIIKDTIIKIKKDREEKHNYNMATTKRKSQSVLKKMGMMTKEEFNDMDKKEIEEKYDISVGKPKEFKLNSDIENTLNLYLAKLEEYHDNIGQEKEDVISQKAKVLDAILGTDMLKID
jgi:actin-like ATPase involved in cell morphogenesis